jgi:hypothetical protein
MLYSTIDECEYIWYGDTRCVPMGTFLRAKLDQESSVPLTEGNFVDFSVRILREVNNYIVDPAYNISPDGNAALGFLIGEEVEEWGLYRWLRHIELFSCTWSCLSIQRPYYLPDHLSIISQDYSSRNIFIFRTNVEIPNYHYNRAILSTIAEHAGYDIHSIATYLSNSDIQLASLKCLISMHYFIYHGNNITILVIPMQYPVKLEWHVDHIVYNSIGIDTILQQHHDKEIITTPDVLAYISDDNITHHTIDNTTTHYSRRLCSRMDSNVVVCQFYYLIPK